MKTTTLIVLTLSAALSARGDFSYTTTQKGGGGPIAVGAPQSTKHFLKGQKMKTESGASATIMDFDAQTMTSINNPAKTYVVTKFGDLGAALAQSGVETKIDLKETGQKKTINGFNTSQVVMSVDVDPPPTAPSAGKMAIEMDMWICSDVPGVKELKAFYEKNSGKFPWAAMSGGAANPMQKTMADLQRKMANLGGVPVLQVTRMKSAGNAAQNADVADKMAKAKANLEAMIAKGGPQAEMAKQMLARMGSPAPGGALMEITMESTGFSAAAIPDSVFAIPAGYTKMERPTAPVR